VSLTDHDKLSALLKQLKRAYRDAEASAPEDATDPVHHLLWSALLWDASQTKARAAYKKLTDAAADLNEFRVLLPAEIAELLGPRYPNVDERAARIRMLLTDVYNREHDVTLASLEKTQKREARKYLETLEGATPYISARTFAVGLDGHAIPVDSRLLEKLVAAGVAEEDADPAAVSGSLERAVKAADTIETIALLETWASDPDDPVAQAARPAAKKTPRKKAGRQTTKKTTKKTAKKTSKAAKKPARKAPQRKRKQG